MTTASPTPLQSKRVALVTGGSRGIGRATTEALLDRGFQVFFCGRSPDLLEETQQELLRRYPDKVFSRLCDVRSQSAVEEMVNWVEQQAGRLDVLVNNAGLGHFGPIDELSGDDFREVIETNLLGAFYAIRAVAPIMKRQGEGWIFNIASLAAKNPFAGGSAYNASKFGMVGMSEAAMLDLRHEGIRVSAICPGSVETDFGGGIMKSPHSSSGWRLSPEDIARVVTDLIDFPARALPSLIEIRPTRPPKK
ncbi:MAG: SDR family oxidoreductase [Thermoanaerobaculia bacterium]